MPTPDHAGNDKILGLRTVIYHVPDLANAKTWYSRVLEHEPYFDQPFYVGYSVGGFELGLIPDGHSGPGGAVAYWGVQNADAAIQRLEELGATIRDAVQDVGEGIRVATVNDPFGNVLGIIENPHFAKEKVR
jgi:predicted enzyme related to lactoylglutathione lyase